MGYPPYNLTHAPETLGPDAPSTVVVWKQWASFPELGLESYVFQKLFVLSPLHHTPMARLTRK